jgi:hypothetical protein
MLQYAAAGALAALVAVAEIANRYRDRPAAALRQPYALLYIAVNVIGAAIALYVVRVFGWTLGVPDAALPVAQVLVAGLSALALFRLQFFSASQNKESVSFSPARLLEQLLAVSDREVDRDQATRRVETVRETMRGISFAKASRALPAYALGLLENVDADDQEKLGADVGELIANKDMTDEVKVQLLGIAVIRVTGPELLRNAIDGLGDAIKAG